MVKGLEGIKVIEVGGAFAMPLAGMLMGSWGAEVIHVEPPGRGDLQRHLLAAGMAGWARPHEVNYIWEHVDRNKKSLTINLKATEGQEIIHRLAADADVFLNNLRPYEMDKFNLGYEKISSANPKIVYANLTGYGQRGPEKNTGGYDSVAFWARSGVMDLMHEPDSAPNISRPAYGDSITSQSLLAGVMAALFIRERTGEGQEVEVSLYNSAIFALGTDLSGCLITGEDSVRPTRKTMSNPIRNIYPTSDDRWIMLGMTTSQPYWPNFCQAIEGSQLTDDPKYATPEARAENASELVDIIEGIFRTKTYAQWKDILSLNKLIWAPLQTPLEVTQDEQAIANDYFCEWDHPEYGSIKLLNNPIKLSRTPASNICKAPDLGEHTDQILTGLGFTSEKIEELRNSGVI
ncbi:MAG: CoA transferase [Desulfobulbaceae bacterium]|nr:MAG: CoA transferase [Desulfobulbaceae bacterium]